MSLDMINQYIKDYFGKKGMTEAPITLSEEGEEGIHVAVMIIEGIQMEIAYFPELDMVGLFSEVMKAPEDADADFFENLLLLNFRETRDGAFALDEDNEAIKFISVRPVEDMDTNEFSALMDNFIKTINEMVEVEDSENGTPQEVPP